MALREHALRWHASGPHPLAGVVGRPGLTQAQAWLGEFGHMSSPNCVWLTQADKNGHVPVGTAPFCGTYVPGTTSVSGSSQE